MEIVISTAFAGVLWVRNTDTNSVVIAAEDTALLKFLADAERDVVITVNP